MNTFFLSLYLANTLLYAFQSLNRTGEREMGKVTGLILTNGSSIVIGFLSSPYPLFSITTSLYTKTESSDWHNTLV